MESVVRVFMRGAKRACKIDVTVDDYDHLWAGASNGGEQLTEKVDYPEIKIVAHRIGPDQWAVNRLTREANAGFTADTSVAYLNSVMYQLPSADLVPFVYAARGEPEILTSEGVLDLMRRSDGTMHLSSGHISHILK